MEECTRVFVIQLSSNIENTICFGPKAGDSLVGTVLAILAYTFGFGVVIIPLWLFSIKRKFNQLKSYIIRQLKRSLGLTKNPNQLEEEEAENRKNLIAGKIGIEEFGLQMFAIDKTIIRAYMKNDFTLKELTSWFLTYRWDRFSTNQIINRHIKDTQEKPITYVSWFTQFTKERYNSPEALDIKRKDEIIEIKIITSLINSENKTESEVKRTISEILKENN